MTNQADSSLNENVGVNLKSIHKHSKSDIYMLPLPLKFEEVILESNEIDLEAL